MKNTIEKIQDSIDDIKTAINTKYLSNGEEAPIEDDTLLEEYAQAIDNIKIETIDVSQQIFVFYCGATNEADAKSKILPTITGNSTTNKWSIECTVGGWSTSPDEEELDPTIQTDAEKYLYAMFVSVNTNTRDISGPDPVRLTGEKGEKGEDGSDGRPGVIEGLTLRNIITLYCASNTEPIIQNISYEQGTDLSQLIPSNIKINNSIISSDPTSYTNQQGSQTYEISPEHPIKIGKIDILYSSKSEAVLLGNRPLLITNVIDVEIKYGTSISPEISPDTWSDEYPANTNNTVGIQRKEKLSDYTVKTIEYPIGLRGPAGIQLIANVESENDLSSISPNYDNDYIGKLGVRVGQNVYIGYGTSDPYLTGSEKIGSNYGLNVGPLSPIPNGNAKEGEDGYIENRTHYKHEILESYYSDCGEAVSLIIPADIKDIYVYYRYSEESCDNESNYRNGEVDGPYNSIFELQNSFVSNEGIIMPGEFEGAESQDNPTKRQLYFGGDCNSYYQIKLIAKRDVYKQLDPKFVQQMIEITYSDLKTLKDKNQLTPGMQYRIIDYNTITVKENTKSAEHPFDLIVTADSVNEINCKARAIHSEGYFDESDLSKGEIGYDFDNRTNYDGIPEEDLEVGAYKENTKGEFSTEVSTGFDYFGNYTNNNADSQSITVRKLKDSDFCINASNMSDTKQYLVYDSEGESVFIPNRYNGWEGSYAIMDNSNNYESAGLYISINGQQYTLAPIPNEDSSGVAIYSLFVATGTQGYIDDFVALRVMENNSVMFISKEAFDALLPVTKEHGENVWVTLDDLSDWVSTYARQLGTAISTYDFGGSIIAPYTVDGNISYFDKVVLQDVIHTGTIYRMIDEFGNDCPYDFKNIKFLNVLNEECYTFGSDCHDNTILPYTSNNMYSLNFITLGNNCYSNNFGNNCKNNNLGNNCYFNSFSNDCSSNNFGNDCHYNNFGNYCDSNNFGESCNNNNFGNSCYSNNFGNYCSANNFGNSCDNNSFGDDCSSNSFGNDCNNNSFGEGCKYNNFGEGCEYNSFGESKDKLGSYYRYIIFDNGNSYINLNCTSTEIDGSNYYQNVRIGLGVNNTYTYKTINDSNIDQTYQTLYKPANSKDLTA